MNKEIELLTSAKRETLLSAGIAGELARIAQERPDGLPLKEVRVSLSYWRTHLLEALDNVKALEEIARSKHDESKGEPAYEH